jgi:hypothetical protein
MSSQNSDGVKVPGWWPGVLEFVSVILFSFNSSFWMMNFREAKEAGDKNAATFMGIVATLVLFIIFAWLFKRRHKKRTAAFPGHNPMLRVRELAILAYGLALAAGSTMLFAEGVKYGGVDTQQAAWTAFLFGIIFLIPYGRVWTVFTEAKSYIWAAVFGLAALLQLKLAYNGIDLFKDEQTLLGIAIIIGMVAWACEGVAFGFGAYGLTKEPSDRSKEIGNLVKFLSIGFFLEAAHFTLNGFALMPEGKVKEINAFHESTLNPNGGLTMGLCMLLIALALRKAGKAAVADGGSAEAPASEPAAPAAPAEGGGEPASDDDAL